MSDVQQELGFDDESVLADAELSESDDDDRPKSPDDHSSPKCDLENQDDDDDDDDDEDDDDEIRPVNVSAPASGYIVQCIPPRLQNQYESLKVIMMTCVCQCYQTICNHECK